MSRPILTPQGSPLSACTTFTSNIVLWDTRPTLSLQASHSAAWTTSASIIFGMNVSADTDSTGMLFVGLYHIYIRYFFCRDIRPILVLQASHSPAWSTSASIIFGMNVSADTDPTGMPFVGLYHIYIPYFFAGIFGRYWCYRHHIHRPGPHLHQLYLV